MWPIVQLLLLIWVGVWVLLHPMPFPPLIRWGFFGIVILAIAALMWRLVDNALNWLYDRRYKSGLDRLARGQCPACEYDMRASPERCPECGWRRIAPERPIERLPQDIGGPWYFATRRTVERLHVAWILSQRPPSSATSPKEYPAWQETADEVVDALGELCRWPNSRFHADDAWDAIADVTYHELKTRLGSSLRGGLLHSDFARYRTMKFAEVVDQLAKLKRETSAAYS